MTDLQSANAAFIETGPRKNWRELGEQQNGRPDTVIVLERFFTYAHGEMEWLELSVNWIPFIQTGPRERKFWSKRRLGKAIDQLVEQGLIEDVDGSDCKWRLTDMGRKWGRR